MRRRSLRETPSGRAHRRTEDGREPAEASAGRIRDGGGESPPGQAPGRIPPPRRPPGPSRPDQGEREPRELRAMPPGMCREDGFACLESDAAGQIPALYSDGLTTTMSKDVDTEIVSHARTGGDGGGLGGEDPEGEAVTRIRRRTGTAETPEIENDCRVGLRRYLRGLNHLIPSKPSLPRSRLPHRGGLSNARAKRATQAVSPT